MGGFSAPRAGATPSRFGERPLLCPQIALGSIAYSRGNPHHRNNPQRGRVWVTVAAFYNAKVIAASAAAFGVAMLAAGERRAGLCAAVRACRDWRWFSNGGGKVGGRGRRGRNHGYSVGISLFQEQRSPS